MKNKIEYFVGVFGFMQLSMIDVGLLDEKARLVKMKYNAGETDAVAIYKWISEQIKHLPAKDLKLMAKKTDNKVKKLISNHKKVNNYLLSIMLLREYIDNDGLRYEQILISPKINRLVDVIDATVSDEQFDANIKRTTSRTANNIYRQFIGKPQLSDEVREAHNKFRRK